MSASTPSPTKMKPKCQHVKLRSRVRAAFNHLVIGERTFDPRTVLVPHGDACDNEGKGAYSLC